MGRGATFLTPTVYVLATEIQYTLATHTAVQDSLLNCISVSVNLAADTCKHSFYVDNRSAIKFTCTIMALRLHCDTSRPDPLQ